jgi:hypothetical protein
VARIVGVQVLAEVVSPGALRDPYGAEGRAEAFVEMLREFLLLRILFLSEGF